jgi:hypothetical protein
MKTSKRAERIMVANHGEWMREHVRRARSEGRVEWCECSRCQLNPQRAAAL